jgi:colanic acid/amylovoran biosynthesis glycosyltransferase
MSARVALVASSSTDEEGAALTTRLRRLLASGWDAHLVARGDRWLEDPALRAVDLRSRVELGPRLERRLRRLRPDLVHFHSGTGAWRGIQDRRLRAARVIIGFREDGCDLAVPDPGLLWARADRLVFPHEAARQRAIARGYPRDKSVVMHAPPLGFNGDAPRGPGRTAVVILSAGPLIWEQGYEHSIHAMRLLRDAGVRCEYRILGQGDHEQAVAFARHQLGLHDVVRLLDSDGGPSLAAELGCADVFLDPAVTDTTSPTALVSAQAHGIPFVATARRGRLPAGGGLVVSRRDPRAMAQALHRLARDPDLRHRMGREGRRAAALAGAAAYVGALERLYRSALTAGT